MTGPINSLPGDSPCPCGGGDYAGCCAAYLRRESWPAIAEALMRSRYTAFALGDSEYLLRTWHPRTRPDDVRPDPGTRWTGLRILAAEADTVEFVASWEGGAMHEVSRFEQRAGRWVYVDGEVDGEVDGDVSR